MSPPTPSPTPTAAPTANAAQSLMRINIHARGVVSTLGYIPTIMLTMMAEQNMNTLSHHRSSVLAHNTMPGKRRAQKMLGANLRRGIKRLKDPRTVDDVYGTGFGVTLARQAGHGWGDFLTNLEEGAQIRASGWMAIPLTGRVATLRKDLAAGKLVLGPRGLLLRSIGGKRARTVFAGVLRRNRFQRPMLGYYPRWDQVVTKDTPKYEKNLDKVLTAAGRAALAETSRIEGIARPAYSAEFKRILAEGGTAAAARKAARELASEIRRQEKARGRN